MARTSSKQGDKNKAGVFFLATLLLWSVSVLFEIQFNKRKELLFIVSGACFYQIANWVIRFSVSRDPLFVNTSASLLHSTVTSGSGVAEIKDVCINLQKNWMITFPAYVLLDVDAIEVYIWKIFLQRNVENCDGRKYAIIDSKPFISKHEKNQNSSSTKNFKADLLSQLKWILTNIPSWRSAYYKTVVFILVNQCLRNGLSGMFEHSELVGNTWPWAYPALCFSCGYFAYDQLDMLLYRLYSGLIPAILVHHLLLLICFTLALYRNVTINYLILTLICELHSIFLHVRKVRRMAGIRNAKSRIVRVEWILNWITFFLARFASHILITIKLIRDAPKFENGIELPLALFGMAGMNLLNAFLGIDLLNAFRREKNPQHVANNHHQE